MKERAYRLFNLYSDEGKQALFFSILGYCLFFAIFLGSKLSDTIFITHLSATKLPLAYGTIALILVMSSLVVILAYSRYSVQSVFFKYLFLGLIFYSTASILLALGFAQTSSLSYFFFKVFAQILQLSILSCFWTFVDQYYHFQDAKRIYALFNASVYLGLTTAGLVIRSSSFTVLQVYSFIVCVLLAILLVAPKLIRDFDEVPDDLEAEVKTPQIGKTIPLFFKSLFTSHFSLILMVGNLLTCWLMTTTEIGYWSSFQQHFQVQDSSMVDSAASRELTQLYGTCLAIAGVINLIAGWFFYSRLVLRFGVTTLVLVSPVAFLITYSGWSFDSTLFFSIVAIFLNESLLPIFEDNNFNILLNGVPLRLKPKVRVLIESFSEPVGMLLSSLLLTFAYYEWKFFGLILGGLSLSVAFAIRNQYFQAIFQNLKDHSLHLHRRLKDWVSTLPRKERKLSEDRLLALLNSSDTEYQRLTIDAIFQMNKAGLVRRLFDLIDNLSCEAKIHLLKLLEKSSFQTEPFVQSKIIGLQQEEMEPELQPYIDFFLARQGLLHPDRAQYNLNSPNLLQRAAAILSLEHSFAFQTLQNVTYNRAIALDELQKLLESNDEEERAMGLALLGIEGSQQNIEILVDYLKHPSLHLAKAAIFALGDCLDSHDLRHAKAIIDEIPIRNDSEFRIGCFKAIAKIGDTTLIRPLLLLTPNLRPPEARSLERAIVELGLKTVPSLVSILNDSSLPDRSRITAGKILAQLALPQLEHNLFSVIHAELKRAYFYFYWAHSLPDEYEGHDLLLLKEGLLSSYQSVIDFIIHLLGASQWIEDCELIVFSLRSKNLKIISQAIETLEMCCKGTIFRKLYPLIADVPLKDKLHFCKKNTDTEKSLPEVLEVLEKSANTLDLFLAATWKYRLDLPNWRGFLRKQMASQKEIFHHFAYELLET